MKVNKVNKQIFLLTLLISGFGTVVLSGTGEADAQGCKSWHYVNNNVVLATENNIDLRRCGIVDNNAPVISKVFATANDTLCVKTLDDNATVKVMINDKEISRWNGTTSNFCTDEPLPDQVTIKAHDRAGNIRTAYLDEDMVLSGHNEKRENSTHIISTFEQTNLNAFQRCELERALDGDQPTNVQQNILDMVLALRN